MKTLCRWATDDFKLMLEREGVFIPVTIYYRWEDGYAATRDDPGEESGVNDFSVFDFDENLMMLSDWERKHIERECVKDHEGRIKGE